ncbi:hypothetical protein GCM10009639_53780 [Kitasatospora putterlickiae]|uniref:Uncharacterized protein n=1 Tax=Kitasatospora putterlickiae TaxID=221725 RepID=A0ABP4J5Z1_9ACTN
MAPRTTYPTLQAKVTALTREVEDGHLEWTGPIASGGRQLLSWAGRTHLVRRLLFEQHYGRPPTGNVLPACGRTKCVAGRHLDDALTRAQHARAYAALGL